MVFFANFAIKIIVFQSITSNPLNIRRPLSEIPIGMKSEIDTV